MSTHVGNICNAAVARSHQMVSTFGLFASVADSMLTSAAADYQYFHIGNPPSITGQKSGTPNDAPDFYYLLLLSDGTDECR